MKEVFNIGNRRELFVDSLLIDRTDNLRVVLNHPQPQEISVACDAPWEGCMAGYNTVMPWNGHYRMYYRGWHINLNNFDGTETARPSTICLAESDDGIKWERAEINQYEYNGDKNNNIVWMGAGDDAWGMHGFAPFIDTNPDCRPDELWKAVGGGWERSDKGLYIMTSPDGVNWSLLSDQPVLAGYPHDSHNTALWSDDEKCYRVYFRTWTEGNYAGLRTISTAVSPDLFEWSEIKELEFTDVPDEQLYTNNIMPYSRAPHIRVGFPARYVERPWSPSIDALPEREHRLLRAKSSPRYGSAVTDTVFMSSRDGVSFKRWGEAFIRPGCRTAGSWAYGDIYNAWGMLQTPSLITGGEDELSFYVTEGYWRGEGSLIRRYSLRLDGFVSVNAPLSGGELITKPLIFDGNRLSLNVSTSAAGSVRVEIQDTAGLPLPGYSLDDCYEIIGDTADYTVQWKNGTDVSQLSAQPIKIRFVLSDADIYAYQFAKDEAATLT